MNDESRTASPRPGSWNAYWEETRSDGRAPLWDCAPGEEGQADLHRFAASADPALPLLDVGCGNGTQTRFLSERFPRVIGVDVSAAALDLARRETTGSSPEFEKLDLFDRDAVHELHRRIGDANLYLRGVLHQVPTALRPDFVASLVDLLGQAGTCHMNELTSTSIPYLKTLADDPILAVSLNRVVSHGIAPGVVTADEVRSLFEPHGIHILADEENCIRTSATRTSDDSLLVIPSRAFLLGR